MNVLFLTSYECGGSSKHDKNQRLWAQVRLSRQGRVHTLHSARTGGRSITVSTAGQPFIFCLLLKKKNSGGRISGLFDVTSFRSTTPIIIITSNCGCVDTHIPFSQHDTWRCRRKAIEALWISLSCSHTLCTHAHLLLDTAWPRESTSVVRLSLGRSTYTWAQVHRLERT